MADSTTHDTFIQRNIHNMIKWFLSQNSLKIAMVIWCIITTVIVCQLHQSRYEQDNIIRDMITVSDRQQNMIIYLMIRNGLSVDRGGDKTNKKDTLEVLYWNNEEGDSDTWMDNLELTYNSNMDTRMDYPYVKEVVGTMVDF